MNDDINENIEENIIGFDALYRSMEKCRKGVIWKDSVAHYYLNAIEETLKLEKQLKTGTYKERKPVQFTIMAPKKREIVSIAFRDRVYQRSLNDNAIYPQMTKGFINTNVACQKGKGTDLAREILKEYLRAMYRKCGKNFSVLQCDIHGYYPNMQHETARQTFRKGLEPHSKQEIDKRLHVMGFEFNPKKTHVYSVGKCIPFLGFNFKLDDKGKVVMLLKSDNVKRERKKLRRLVNKCKRGEITKEKVNVCYAGWRVHAEKGDSKHLLDRMDKFYKDLWKGAK